jgi:DNA-binding NtrC family response regulator
MNPMSDGNEPPADFSDLLPFHLVGQGSAFQQVLKTIRLVARYDVLVALYGETGTGKELVARAIHYLSSRARGPFEPINCGGLTDSLLESELFGHRRGAFTDARSDRAGLVEKANGGTLFLDEVEALSTKGQVALLRFLQDFSFRRVGGQRLRSVDTRIIAATNVPLDELVAQDSGLRQDLYFRLNVMPLRLPPLRERKEDIPLLAEYFLQRYAAQYDIESRGISDAALWPARNALRQDMCIRNNTLLRRVPNRTRYR